MAAVSSRWPTPSPVPFRPSGTVLSPLQMPYGTTQSPTSGTYFDPAPNTGLLVAHFSGSAAANWDHTDWGLLP